MEMSLGEERRDWEIGWRRGIRSETKRQFFSRPYPLGHVEFYDRVRFLANARGQFLRREDPRMFSPTEDPALDLFQAAKLQFEDDRAVLALTHSLRLVPLSFRHQPRGEGIELDTDALLFSRRIDPEASAQDLRYRKIRGAPKAFCRQLHFAHARQGERPQLPPLHVFGE